MENKTNAMKKLAVKFATAVLPTVALAMTYPPYDIYTGTTAGNPQLTYTKVCEPGRTGEGNASYVILGSYYPSRPALVNTAYEGTPDLTPVDDFTASLTMFGLAIVSSLIIITVFRFGLKANRNIGKGVVFEKPEAYDPIQKKTLTLILCMMAVVLIFPVLNLIFSGNSFISYVAGKVDVGLVAFVFAMIALLMKLAPQKEIIAKVPWNTILMIAGAGMLIAVAVKAGTIDMLSNWIGSNVPTWLVPLAFSIVGAIMSFFSSTTGVVCPALFPLIPALAASTGLSPVALFTCTVLGAQSSAISPFSSGGSLILGSCGNEEERTSLFNRLLFKAVPISVGICAVYNLIVSFIL